MPIFLLQVALLRARLRLAESSLGFRPNGQPGLRIWAKAQTTLAEGTLEAAREHYEAAAKLVHKHGYKRWLPDLAVLGCEIDPSLENFQNACTRVGGEGWWHLMPRLEALAAGRGRLFGKRKQWTQLLLPLREAEKAYHAEREAYLAREAQPKEDEGMGEMGSMEEMAGLLGDGVLAQLPEEVIQQIAAQTGAPADWRQWHPELKAQIVQAWLQSQQPPET